jgi:porin
LNVRLFLLLCAVSAPAVTSEAHALSSADSRVPLSTTEEEGADESSDPLEMEVAYTGAIFGNVNGGRKRGAVYLDNLDVIATADFGDLIGAKGLTGSAYVLYNNGRPFSEIYPGDAQVVSNIETGVTALRLYEFWLQQEIGPLGSVRIGLYDLNSEFDVLDISSLFLNSAFGIGTDISQSGENGPSIFPSTSLGARFEIRASGDLTLRAAVLDGVPGDPWRPARTTVRLCGGDCALLIGEGEYKTGPLKILAGAWRYTAETETFVGSSHNNKGIYLRGEAQLTSERNAPDQGLAAFARFGIADEHINVFSRIYSGGLVYTGPFGGRDGDAVGMGFSWAESSPAFAQVNRANAGREVVLEATYSWSVTDWLTIQPDFQYVINPGLRRDLDNALVLGLQFSVGRSF